MNRKRYTEEEIASITDMVKHGISREEIAKRTGRSRHSINEKLSNLHIGTRKSNTPFRVIVNPQNVSLSGMGTTEAGMSAAISAQKETNKVLGEAVYEFHNQKTLDDFTPREMIRHLYNKGYRIKGDALYQIVEKKVLLEDIIR